MGSDLGICANIIRFFLIIINGFFIAIALTVIGIGGWLISENDDFSFVTGNSIISGGALLITAGIITTLICAVGIIGTIFKLRPLLFIYAIVVLLIVILEIVAGILGFVYRDAIDNVIRDRSLDAIRLYNPNLGDPNSNQENADATLAVDAIQTAFQCCGYDNASDWLRYNLDAVPVIGAPPNCPLCNPLAGDSNCVRYSNLTVLPPRTFFTNVTGCRAALENRVVLFGSVAGGIGIVFGILEIIGVIFSLVLCCCITGARRQELV